MKRKMSDTITDTLRSDATNSSIHKRICVGGGGQVAKPSRCGHVAKQVMKPGLSGCDRITKPGPSGYGRQVAKPGPSGSECAQVAIRGPIKCAQVAKPGPSGCAPAVVCNSQENEVDLSTVSFDPLSDAQFDRLLEEISNDDDGDEFSNLLILTNQFLSPRILRMLAVM